MPMTVPPSVATQDPSGSVPRKWRVRSWRRRSSWIELPVTGSWWRASMASSPLSNAATAAGTSASVMGR